MYRFTCSLCTFALVSKELALAPKDKLPAAVWSSTEIASRCSPTITLISRRHICNSNNNVAEQIEDHHQNCCSRTTNYSTMSANKRKMKFDLSMLPLHLREEFDVESNKHTLRFLLSHPPKHAAKKKCSSSNTVNNADVMCHESNGDLDNLLVTITVLPTWVYNVSWVCRHCHTEWMARPVDRISEQTTHAHNCPRCSDVHFSSATSSDDLNTLTLEATANDAKENVIKAQERREGCQEVETPSKYSSLSSAPSSSQHSSGSSLLLLASYPALAAQWDVKRNNLLPNQVVVSLHTVKCNSTMMVWWTCPHCGRPWREAVNNRVARYEKWKNAHHCQSNRMSNTNTTKNKNKNSSSRYCINDMLANKDITHNDEMVIPLCPSCEVRGSSDKINNTCNDVQHVKSQRYLIQDDLLMSEVILRPHDDPATISMESEMLLNWHCRFCEYEFVASVADRALRHVRCPQCTGAIITAYNALLVQRPDVIHEMSSTVSEYKLRKLTIYSPEEVTFVCRRCCCPYRMTIKARCAIPKGIAACSKCFLTQSNAANKMLNTLSANNNSNEQPLTRRQSNSIKQAALRSMKTNYSNERLAYVQHALQLKDNSLLN